MTASDKPRYNIPLRAASVVLFVAAGFAFLWGGRALAEFEGVNRMLAEVEGIVVALACGILGGLAKAAAKK